MGEGKSEGMMSEKTIESRKEKREKKTERGEKLQKEKKQRNESCANIEKK